MRFKPDLDDQLVSFSALTLGLVPEMTYNVLSGALNTNQPTIADETGEFRKIHSGMLFSKQEKH